MKIDNLSEGIETRYEERHEKYNGNDLYGEFKGEQTDF